MEENKKLPELKSKPIIGVPEEEWHKWTMKRLISLENLNPPDKKKIIKKKRESAKGNTSRYKTGRMYIEVTTGFIGTLTEMCKRFNQTEGALLMYAKRGTPLSKGKSQGLHFQIYKEK